MKIRTLMIMLMTVLFSASVCSAGAVSYPNNINTHSESVLLVSMDNGQTVYEKDADKQMYPASRKLPMWLAAPPIKAAPHRTRQMPPARKAS